MLIYLCNYLNETEVNVSASCNGEVGETVSECRQGSLIAGWAVGGTVSNVYPCHETKWVDLDSFNDIVRCNILFVCARIMVALAHLC